MPDFTRRSALGAGLTMLGSAPLLGSCAPAELAAPKGATRIHVIGTIHRRHLSSKTYPLSVLERALRAAKPDVILAEIPPERIGLALKTFADTGKVDEPRTNLFPEFTELVIPLAPEMGWRVLGTAAWTKEIADNRREALTAIENDPKRAADWATYQNANAEFARDMAGRSQDPRFIHTPEFDDIVRQSRETYARLFDDGLGPGGWTQINAAHNALINAALDTVRGKSLTVCILFGTAHKYKILESVSARDDVVIEDSAQLFV